jgi:hypothetical protein
LKLLTVTRENRRFAACPMVLRRQVPNPSPLLQELFDHPQRDAKPLRHVGARSPELVVAADDPFPHIQTDGFHAARLPQGGTTGYTIN